MEATRGEEQHDCRCAGRGYERDGDLTVLTGDKLADVQRRAGYGIGAVSDQNRTGTVLTGRDAEEEDVAGGVRSWGPHAPPDSRDWVLRAGGLSRRYELSGLNVQDLSAWLRKSGITYGPT